MTRQEMGSQKDQNQALELVEEGKYHQLVA
jgi:hypothetical protein